MTRTRFTLDDLGGGLSGRALASFLGNLPPESAAVAGMRPDRGGWSRTEMLLARICEGIEELAWITACRGVKRSKWPRRPERIPRPGVEPDKGRVIGKEPIPISEFDTWYGGE